MPLNKFTCFLFFLLLLGLQNAWGQSWLWGSEGTWKGIGPNLYESYAVTADKYGNAYIVGGGYDTVRFGNDTINSNNLFFIVKYDSTGTIQWATQANETSSNIYGGAGAITTDSSGNVYVAGGFNDTATFGSYRFIFKGGVDDICAFVAKYSPGGKVIWAKQATPASSASSSYGGPLVTDASGNIYVMGSFSDTISFGTNILISSRGSTFLVKYDANGNVLWAVQANTSKNIYSSATGCSLTVDFSGNVYVTGYFTDTVYFGSNTLVARKLYNSAFIVKYDTNGNVLWAEQSNTTYRPKGYSEANSIITDKAGNIYITGYFTDTLYFGSYMLTTTNKYYAETFLAKYAPDGSVLWAKQSDNEGAPYEEYGYGISMLATDTNNHIYFEFLAGDSNFTFGGYSFNVPVVPYYINVFPHIGTVCIAKLDTSGKVECASLYPNPNNFSNATNLGDALFLVPIGIATDESGKHIYITGTNFDDTLVFNNDSLTANKVEDFPYIARWEPCGDEIDTGNSIPTEPCPFIPDAFSPNVKGHNNILYVRGACISSMDFIVFDRWGNKVFESQNIADGWDGTYRGKPLNTGTYMWYLKATMLDGTSVEKKGNVALVR